MLLFWDASALAKRYFGETGSDTVNALFTHVPIGNMATTPWGYVETYAMLARRLNAGVIDRPTFTTILSALQSEVAESRALRWLTVSDRVIFASTAAIRSHNLNATDAAILTMLLEYVAATPADEPLVLVAADQRLLRAAAAEGLRTLNPETIPAADVPAFLGSL